MNLRNIITIARHAAADELHYKSFYALFGIAVGLILLSGGCYRSNFNMNGSSPDNSEIVRMVVSASFHFITAVSMLLVALIGSRAFRSDRENGNLMFILAKPVSRTEYALGRITALFVIGLVFMFLLHAVVMTSALIFPPQPRFMPLIPVASLTVALNPLFAIVLVLTLALFLPDFIAVLFTAGIVLVGYITGPLYGLLQQAGSTGGTWVSTLKTICTVWPQTGTMQSVSAAIVHHGPVTMVGPLHPAINLTIWIVALGAIFLHRIDKQDF